MKSEWYSRVTDGHDDCATRTNTFSVPLDAFYVPLDLQQALSAEDTTRRNRSPALLTERLREMVPLLRVVGFEVEAVSDSSTSCLVPLLASTMNQNGTHQASVFYLLADYTAGIAAWASLSGTYAVGVHDRCAAQPIQLWLKKNTVTHLRLGTGVIRGTTTLADSVRQQVSQRLVEKGRCDVPAHVDIYQENELLATAEVVLGVYCDKPRVPDRKADLFQSENSKLSALMIAGLRNNPDSQAVAGDQGRALALRFAEVTPQLPHMIEARGLHLQKLLQAQGDRFAQVVILGHGMDTNPLHYMKPGQTWYGLDLRQTLALRKKQFDLRGGGCARAAIDPHGFSSQRVGTGALRSWLSAFRIDAVCAGGGQPLFTSRGT